MKRTGKVALAFGGCSDRSKDESLKPLLSGGAFYINKDSTKLLRFMGLLFILLFSKIILDKA